MLINIVLTGAYYTMCHKNATILSQKCHVLYEWIDLVRKKLAERDPDTVMQNFVNTMHNYVENLAQVDSTQKGNLEGWNKRINSYLRAQPCY